MKFYLILFIFFISACTTNPNVQEIVDKVIQTHGGNAYLKSLVKFDFRGKHFIVKRDGGVFRYERIFTENDTVYHEVLDNSGLKRTRNGFPQKMTTKQYGIFHEAVNSVVYFLFLPYALNDDAVQKKYLAVVDIRGSKYFQIEVTFRQEGGGVDYNDRFIHYIHTKNFTLDYFSYADEGGNRFREFKNRRNLNGIIFNDYNNFKEEVEEHQVEAYYRLFNDDKLKLLSSIETENIKVELIQ